MSGSAPAGAMTWRSRLLRIAPFTGVCLLVFPVAVVFSTVALVDLVPATVVLVLVLVLMVLLPWETWPLGWSVVPTVLFCIGVFLLRDASGAALSGFGSSLLILPIVWAGVYGAPRQLLVTVPIVAASLALPIVLIGAPEYAATTEVPRTIVTLVAWSTVGWVVNDLVSRLRESEATMARLVTRLDDLARTDTLTGLNNRRAWDGRLAEEIDRANRSRGSVVVAFIDVDHFKRFNDDHGHQAGDRFLVELAEAWGPVVRRGDFLSRWGGEEFGLILSGADEALAVEVVGRLRALVPAGLTVSAGIAIVGAPASVDDVLAVADRALYAAKDAGRDRVVVDTSVGDPDGAADGVVG